MKKGLFYDLVAKELSGTASDSETKVLQSMIKVYGLEEEYDRLTNSWQKEIESIGVSPYNLERVRSEIKKGIKAQEPDFEMGDEAPVRMKIWRRVAQVAAVIVFVSLMAVLVSQWPAAPDEDVVAIHWIEKTTKAGQTSTISFRDGSVITLNGNSSVRFPEKFSEEQREIFFSGEGYFDIATNPDRPFIVHVDQYAVQVLGTIFNINAYENDSDWEVALLEGKVVVDDENKTMATLQPGQLLTVNKPSSVTTLSQFDPRQVVGWKDKKFVFEGTPLEDVLEVFTHRYGVQFQYDAGTIVKCRVNASFEDESIWTMLEAIKYATGLSYEVKNGVVYLKGNGC